MNAEIFLNIILVLIGLYLAMFKSYFREKGKNLATNEDIENLTLKVESVKQQFLEKNASINAKLNLLTNLQTSHRNDKRLAFIDFHKKIKSWTGLLTESSPPLIDDYDNMEIQNKIHLYDLSYSKVLAAEALLELYIDDEILINLIQELKTKVLEVLGSHPKKLLIDLKYNNLLIRELDSEQHLETKTAKHMELLDKRTAIFDKYGKEMIEGYKQIIPFDTEYREYAKNYISKITSE